jgi:hypothetical protein
LNLPNAERAVVELAKLRDYCINPDHPTGKHKARVFKSALGFRTEDAEKLREALLEAVRYVAANPGELDEYGQRYTIDVILLGPEGPATVRSSWIVRAGEDFPRLITCYVL